MVRVVTTVYTENFEQVTPKRCPGCDREVCDFDLYVLEGTLPIRVLADITHPLRVCCRAARLMPDYKKGLTQCQTT